MEKGLITIEQIYVRNLQRIIELQEKKNGLIEKRDLDAKSIVFLNSINGEIRALKELNEEIKSIYKGE